MKVGGNLSDMPGRPAMSNPILQQLIHLESSAVEIHDFQINDMTIKSEDLYIFSASHSYGDAVHRRWLASEKYNSCYRIKAAHLFFRAISKVLISRATFIGMHRVRYHDTPGEIDVNSPMARLKPWQIKGGETYGDQVEVRGIWKALDVAPIAAIVVEVPEAVQFCAPHAEVR